MLKAATTAARCRGQDDRVMVTIHMAAIPAPAASHAYNQNRLTGPRRNITRIGPATQPTVTVAARFSKSRNFMGGFVARECKRARVFVSFALSDIIGVSVRRIVFVIGATARHGESIMAARIRNAPVVLLLASTFLGTPVALQLEPWTDPADHVASLVPVAPGVDLEVLDWRGTGPFVLLLSGIGNTAHVFDDFARYLTGRFRVVGMTRRGFGASGRPTTGYDIPVRVQDVLAVLDHMSIQRVILVGHSIAGEEMTRFATVHPSRVQAIVYLDAAYDHTKTPQVPGPEQRMTPGDKESVERLNQYLARTLGYRYPEGELRATGGVFDANGKFIRDVVSSGAGRQVLSSVQSPDYRGIRVPTLAIYQPMTLRSLYPNADAFEAPARGLAERQVREARIWWQYSIDQYRAQAANGRTVVLESGGHHVFLTNASEVARLMLSFLEGLPPS